ncbi:2,5-dichloro-2,5-cyclohexadiene-1,4-diol dehydrogenase [compost metagenome]|uniref:SDR family NAD(P)-dependent oxidoreductase n=1 Tax=Pseudomonas sp. JUb96 TaxID=2940539 RepID=UPI000FA20470|nr:SDR family NAD(P)-dependent oxidoreductase [Pseudomonas sp. JUb96]MCW2271763.1 NAD(P)-dependent dehydrogenase (short-subunit alcohol dehydrogenase family) [Pseudomonas sp. JUb96]
MADLHNKVAIVTGGASGIGRASALLMAREGAKVVVADMSERAGRDVVAEIEQAGGIARFQALDVRSDESCAALVAETLRHFGQLDIAFNNAGIFASPSLTEDQGLTLWQQMLEVNLTGVFNCMVHELQAMKAGGGSIINTASVAGIRGTFGAAAYSASKHGVIGLTRSAALEYGKYGVRINALCPGLIETPMTAGPGSGFSEQMINGAVRSTPLRRQGSPEEMAEMVLWLAGPRAAYSTGAHYVVDGGFSA